jgi:hypothetical protein
MDAIEGGQSAFVNWYLERAEPHRFTESFFQDRFAERLSAGWAWHDPLDDCSYALTEGLEIHAANGRDLWHVNLSAPRMLRALSTEGDFAIQARCSQVSEEQPAIGGLLLWQDCENYLRLDRGTRGAHEISLEGCLGNQDVIIGRGRLQMGKSASLHIGKSSERVFLRLERVGDRVRGLCSVDEDAWFSVGEAAFPVRETPPQVGLHAIGNIDRTIYHGAYADGTAIRFEVFTLWVSEH